MSTTTTTTMPAIGSALAGGIYCGITTGPDGVPYALVLLADKPAKLLTWKAANTWAEKLGATLPNRPEGALLYANAKAQFEPAWHWLSESFDGSYAWGQSFSNGTQLSTHESYEGRARAVRRFPLQSFNPSIEVAQ